MTTRRKGNSEDHDKMKEKTMGQLVDVKEKKGSKTIGNKKG